MARICIDLDGVIAQLRKEGEHYRDLQPVPGAVEKINQLKSHGHYIIIYTARNMKTCHANVSKVMANVGKVTLDWLDKHGVVYDEICFGKPWADVYIDDNGYRFSHWTALDGDGNNLPLSQEKLYQKQHNT